jgi:transglutaminase-like putative cysteine protease
MKTISVLLTVLGALFPSVPAFAKLAGVADLPYIIESDFTTVTVEPSGQYKLIRDTVFRIVNDQGRESQSVQTLTFNSRAQTFKILEAATLNGPPEKVVRTNVPKTDIEIKEIGEMSQAFDSIKQAAVSYPAVQIGSRLKLRYEIYNREVALKNFWSMGFSVAGDYIEKFEFKVQSKLPLNVRVHDLENRLTQSSAKASNGLYTVTVSSKVPIATTATQEENPFMRSDRVPSVSLSTLPDWSNYAKEMIPVHEKLLSKPLPPVLEEIRKKAELEKTPIEKIQRVAATIAQEFRYFGDWRRRHGGYVPRSLDEIATSRYGDCKDLSLIATAIYRALGFNANLSWIYRGDIAPADSAYEIPVDTSFNHAISRVEAEGKVYWIDATNPVAYARGVFPDIADRPAFVLSAKGAKLDRTPALTAQDAAYDSKLTYEFQGDETVKVSGDVTLGGRTAIGLTARAFYSPVEAVNYDLIRALANNQKVSDTYVGDFDRGTRIVHDTTVPVKFTLAETGLRTSAGSGFPLYRDDSVGRLLVETKERISDIYLDSPTTSRAVMQFLNVKKIGKNSLDCALKSEWADFSRQVKDTNQGVEVTDVITVKKSVVPVEVLERPEFLKFQDALRVCFNRAAVIVGKR